MSARKLSMVVDDSTKPLTMASSGPPSLSSLSTAILEASLPNTIDDDALPFMRSVSRRSAVPLGEPIGMAAPSRRGVTPVEEGEEIEPPVSLQDHTKDHLLRSVFHVPEDDTTTLRRSAWSPSEEDCYHHSRYDFGAAPMTQISPQALQREYDRDTWLLFMRIHALQAARGQQQHPLSHPRGTVSHASTAARSLPAAPGAEGAWGGHGPATAATHRDPTQQVRNGGSSFSGSGLTAEEEDREADDAEELSSVAANPEDEDIFELELEL